MEQLQWAYKQEIQWLAATFKKKNLNAFAHQSLTLSLLKLKLMINYIFFIFQ